MGRRRRSVVKKKKCCNHIEITAKNCYRTKNQSVREAWLPDTNSVAAVYKLSDHVPAFLHLVLVGEVDCWPDDGTSELRTSA